MKEHRTRLFSIIAAAVLLIGVILTGCSGQDSAEAQVKADIESMRAVELDSSVSSEIKSMMSEQGREYYDAFMDKAGNFDYKIMGSEEENDTAVVQVRITTYDFGSEYLKSWTEFLEQPGAASEDGSSVYDTAALYETLFRNLSSLDKKEYIGYAEVECTRQNGGTWVTDADSNRELHNAMLGGMLSEIGTLAGADEQ